jgi:hypothetical protein
VTVTSAAYPLAYLHLGRGRVDLLTADLRAALLTSGYSPADTHQWFADVQSFETVGAGYTAGGTALPNTAFDFDLDAGRAVLTCDQLLFDQAGFTARYAVVFAAAGDAGSSPLLAYVDFGDDVSPGGQPFPLTFSGGVLRLGPVTA